MVRMSQWVDHGPKHRKQSSSAIYREGETDPLSVRHGVGFLPNAHCGSNKDSSSSSSTHLELQYAVLR